MEARGRGREPGVKVAVGPEAGRPGRVTGLALHPQVIGVLVVARGRSGGDQRFQNKVIVSTLSTGSKLDESVVDWEWENQKGKGKAGGMLNPQCSYTNSPVNLTAH